MLVGNTISFDEDGSQACGWTAATVACCVVSTISPLSVFKMFFPELACLIMCFRPLLSVDAALEGASALLDRVSTLLPTSSTQLSPIFVLIFDSTSGWKPSGRGSSRPMKYSRRILRFIAGSAGLVSARTPTPKTPPL